jgi:hypothetical protein
MIRPRSGGIPAAAFALSFVLLLGGSFGPVARADSPGEGGALDTEIEVDFDVKPTSCPNPFNPGHTILDPTFPSAILGTEDLDVSTITIESLVITVPGGGGGLRDTQIPPIQYGYEDVATPYTGSEPCGCSTEGPDGFTDLTLHFDATAIADALGDVWGGQVFELCISGTLEDGTPFLGCDCIIIVGPVSVDPRTWGDVKAEYR